MNLEKCISMGGYSNVIPGQPNDYRILGNSADGPVDTSLPPSSGANWSMREEIRSLRCSWIKLWVSWYELAQGLNRVPADFDELAAMMDHSYGWVEGPQFANGEYVYPDGVPRGNLTQPLIRYLDQTIKLANSTPRWDYPISDASAPKTGVILGVYQDAPVWSWWNGSAASAPYESHGIDEGKPRQHFPNDLGTDSPYGWFIRYLIARYNGGITSPFPGLSAQPAGTPKRGNPDGAYIHMLEPLNEPNYALWPQAGATCAAATAITTCESWCRYYSQTYNIAPIWTLGPGTADKNNSKPFPDGDGYEWQGCEGFTEGVAAQLRGLPLEAPVRWSHHNYHDIEDLVDTANPPRLRSYADSNVSKVEQKLEETEFLAAGIGWNVGAPRDIWLTEGTYRMSGRGELVDPFGYYSRPTDPNHPESRYAEQGRQRDHIANNYEEMRAHADTVLWTQHILLDGSLAGDDPTYALREPWRGPPVNGPGLKRRAWEKFRSYNPSGADFPEGS